MRLVNHLTKHWPILLVLGLALGLRLPLLNHSFWLDEAAQALESARPLSQQLNIIPDFQPPLLHLLVHFSLYVSDSEWWLRFVTAVIPGLITILATYQIGKKHFSNRVGLWAAVLLATSSFHIFFSQELRPYSLPAMWAVLGWWWVTGSAKEKASQWQWWSVWVLLSIAGWYSSYLYPFIWLAQVVYLSLTYKKQWRQLILSLFATGIAFLPWLPRFLQQLQAGQELRVSLPGWQEVVSFSQLKTVPLVALKFLFGVVNIEPNIFFLVSSLLFFVLVAGLAITQKRWSTLLTSKAFILVSLWLVLPLVIAWIISFFVPVIQPKRVLYLLPAFYLGLSWLSDHTEKRWQWLGKGLFGLLLFLNLMGTAQYFTQPLLQREDWRGLHQTLSNRYSPAESLVIFAFPEPFAPWRWYDNGQYRTISLGYLVDTPDEIITAAIKPAPESRYLIIFDYLRDLSDPQHRIQQEIESFGYQSLEILDYPNIGFIRIYGKKGVTVSDSSVTIE